MSRIAVLSEEGIKGIIIDGFFPGFSSLKEINWNKEMRRNLSTDKKDLHHFKRYTFNKYLKKERAIPNTRTRANVYREIIKLTRNRGFNNHNQSRLFATYPASGYDSFDGLLTRVSKRKEGGIIRDSILYIAKEIDFEKEKEQDYFFDVSIYDSNCPRTRNTVENLHYNWINFLNFKSKDENNYFNFMRYKQAAEEILENFIENALRKEFINPIGNY